MVDVQDPRRVWVINSCRTSVERLLNTSEPRSSLDIRDLQFQYGSERCMRQGEAPCTLPCAFGQLLVYWGPARWPPDALAKRPAFGATHASVNQCCQPSLSLPKYLYFILSFSTTFESVGKAAGDQHSAHCRFRCARVARYPS